MVAFVAPAALNLDVGPYNQRSIANQLGREKRKLILRRQTRPIELLLYIACFQGDAGTVMVCREQSCGWGLSKLSSKQRFYQRSYQRPVRN